MRPGRGFGYGWSVLAEPGRRPKLASRQTIGVAAVLIHTKDEAAKRSYLHAAEFIKYPNGIRTLFLPTKTMQAGMG